MSVPTSIPAEKLARLIGTPGAPAFLDIRTGSATGVVPGSVRRDAATLDAWAPSFAGRAAIVVDEHGAQAPGVAAWLRSEGVRAETLAGGVAAWQAAGLPLLDPAHLPPRDPSGRTVWVTRARPKVDRIACPWLIRRFVDPDARFLFVPPADVLATAERLGAEPFDLDAPGVFWTHRGERCTFDLMVEIFGLADWPGLAHLAPIVRGADTARPELVPEAAGLLAISLGLSRVHADDLAQIEAGMAVYDALYRWCRDARGEVHDWTSHSPGKPARATEAA